MRESDAAAHEPRDLASHDRPTEHTLSDRQHEPGLPAFEQPRSYEPSPTSFPERETTPDSAQAIPADPHPAPPRVGTPHPQQHDAERNGPPALGPAGPTGPTDGEHGHPLLNLNRHSLVGAKIVDASGRETVRAHVLAALPASVQEHRQVTMALNAALDAATFLARHEQMVNEGWTFPLQVGSTKYEVRITARPLRWHLSDSATATSDGGGFERAATAKVAAPDKETLTVSTVASPIFRDFEATVIDPSSSASPLGLITMSARIGGYAHLTSTSLKAASETTATTVFTGPTRRYTSTFEYDADVLGPSGHPIRPPDERLPPVAGEVTAEIARVDAIPTTPVASDARIRRPLEITGLDHVLDEVFRELPRERSLSGTAHHAIRDFLSPKNVLAHYDQARDGGLVSPTLTLSDGRRAWLRLTVTEERTSSSQGIIAEKQTLGTKTSSENGTGRLKFHSWKVGASGAVLYNSWQATAPDMESSWPTFGLGYSYSPTRLYEQWVNQGFTLESSVAHTGTSDLLSNNVTFVVEVLRQNNSMHPDRRITRTVVNDHRRTHDEENPPGPLLGSVLGLRERAPVPSSSVSRRADLDSLDRRTTDTPEDGVLPADADVSDPPPVPQDLRALLASHRATVIDFPGSRELQMAIAEELRRVAPGTLPLTTDHPNRARSTPLILENERTFRDHLSASHLLGDVGQLLDRTYSFGLDTPAGRTATVRVWTEIGEARHEGAAQSTAQSTITMNVTNQHKLLHERKHEITGSGAFRRALNPPDTVRFTPGVGGAAAFAPVSVDHADTETQVARGFVYRGTADMFGYQVTHNFSITLHEKGSRPEESKPSTHGGRPVQPENDARLRVEVRRPDILPAPPSPRFDRLPSMHAITLVFGADEFREQVEGALEHAHTESPDLGEAVRALTGETQLRGLISASHSGWVNSLDQHIGTGRNPKSVGVAVRTGPFRDWTFRQTYTDVTQQLKVRSTTSTTAGDQRSHWFNGNVSAEFFYNPSTHKGELVNSHQERFSVRAKAGHHGESNDMLTHETSTTRTVSHTGTGHLYEATVDVIVVGRVTDPDGTPHIGPPIPHTYKVLVLLSDHDVIRGPADARPDGSPEQRLQAPLLNQGITGGTVVRILDTDPILRDIHRQLGGDPTDRIPVNALPFANAFSAESISARFDDIAGPGIVERFVLTTHRGHVITEVFVRRRADGSSWRSEGHRSDLQMTSESKREEKVTDETKRVLQGTGESSFRVAVNPAVQYFNSVWFGGTLTPWERSREVGVKAGVGTSVGSKTTGFGDANYLFTNGINLDVVVTQRIDNGPFLHLPEPPSAGGVIIEASAWVPESLVGIAPPQAYPETPRSADPGPARRLPDVEQGLSAPGPTPEWQTPLRRAHHLVGFDNVNELLTQAVRIQATNRRWGPGLLGQLGHYSSAVLNGAARGAWWVVSAPLPTTVTEGAGRFLRRYSADDRLTENFQALNSEKVLGLREQLALRQTFSAQSLSTLFHRLQNADPATPHRIPGTSVAVSLHATGSAETVGHRADAQDEITTAVTGVSSTHTLRSDRRDFTPNLSILGGNPLVAFPINTGHFNSEKLSFDPSNPVTLTPGTPSRNTPTASLPAGLNIPDTGKAKITGAELLRQRVVFTLRHQDDHGIYGAPETVHGHVLYWSAAAPSDAEHPSPAGASGATSHPLRRTATDDSTTPPHPTRTVHDSEASGQDRRDGDADVAEAFRPATARDPQPLPPGSKSSGKQPALGELDRSGLRTRVAQAQALAGDLLTPFSATELTEALRRMEHSEQSTRTASGDVPVMDRDRAVRLVAEAHVVSSRAQTGTHLPSPPVHTSRTDDPQPSADDRPSPPPADALSNIDAAPALQHGDRTEPAAPHADHTEPAPPHADHMDPAADPAHKRNASILPAPVQVLDEIARNETLFFHPARLPAVRLRGPRWSYKDTRAVHRLTAAQYMELPEATRMAAHKERVETTLDPQTLAETDQLLFRGIARVGRRLIGTPLENVEVLEELGRRDAVTRGYWDRQDVRDQTLGQAARRALTQYADSRPELREATRAVQVRAALSADDNVQAVEQLLDSYKGVVIGGNHAATPTWTFLAENMERLRLDTIYLESVRGDSYQADLDAYLGDHTARMRHQLDTYVRLHDRNIENNGLRAVLEAARRHHVRVVGVDGRPARKPRRTALVLDRSGADFHRAAMLNTYTAGLIRADQAGRPNTRYVAVVGQSHVGTHPGPDRVLDVFGSTFTPDNTFPGIDNLLNIPGLVQDPAGNLRAHPTATRAENWNAPDRPAPRDHVGEEPSTADLNQIVYQVETFNLHERLNGLLHETLASEDPSIDQIAALARARSLTSRNVTELRRRDHAAGDQPGSTVDTPQATPHAQAGLSRAEGVSTAESEQHTKELRNLVSRQLTHWGRAELIRDFDDAYAAMPDAHRRRLLSQQADVIARNLVTGTFAGPLPGGAQSSSPGGPVFSGSSSTLQPAEIPTTPTDYVRDIKSMLESPQVDVARLLNMLQIRRLIPRLGLEHLEEAHQKPGNGDLRHSVTEAVQHGRIHELAQEDILRGMGLIPELEPDELRLQHIPSPDGITPWQAPEVTDYAEEVHDTDDAEDVLDLLRNLDRNPYSLWALTSSFSQQYGIDLHQYLSERFPDHSQHIEFLLGQVLMDWVTPEMTFPIFQHLRAATVDHPESGPFRLTSDYPEDGAHLRTHLLANEIRRMGFRPQKIFLSGGVPGLKMSSPRAFGATDNEPREVRRDTYSAVALLVNENGTPRLRVFDTAFDRLMGVDIWAVAAGVQDSPRTVSGSLREIQSVFARELSDDPGAYFMRAGRATPGQSVIAISTDDLGYDFPFPNQRQPDNRAATEERIRTETGDLYRHLVYAERRQLARAMWRELENHRGTSHALYQRMQSLIPDNSLEGLTEGFFDDYPGIIHAMAAKMPAFFTRIANNFPDYFQQRALAINIRRVLEEEDVSDSPSLHQRLLDTIPTNPRTGILDGFLERNPDILSALASRIPENLASIVRRFPPPSRDFILDRDYSRMPLVGKAAIFPREIQSIRPPENIRPMPLSAWAAGNEQAGHVALTEPTESDTVIAEALSSPDLAAGLRNVTHLPESYSDADLYVALARFHPHDFWGQSVGVDGTATIVALLRRWRDSTDTSAVELIEQVRRGDWIQTSGISPDSVRLDDFHTIFLNALDVIATSQRMVPSGRDVVIAGLLMPIVERPGQPSATGAAAERQFRQTPASIRKALDAMPQTQGGSPTAEQLMLMKRLENAREDVAIFDALRQRANIPVDPPPGADAPSWAWKGLAPQHVTSLVMLERAGRQLARRELGRVIDQFSDDETWDWAVHYPTADPQRMQEIAYLAHSYIENNMDITVNYNLDQIVEGGTLFERIISNPQKFMHNSWEISNRTPEDFKKRGAVEERLGMSSVLRRNPEDDAPRAPLTHAPGKPGFSPRASETDLLPKYAARAFPHQLRGGAPAFGSAVFRLKREVLEVVSHTPQDSYMQDGGSRRATGAHHLFPLLAHSDSDVVRMIFAEATDYMYDHGPLEYPRAEFPNPHYLEAQIFMKTVGWDKVDHIRLLPRDDAAVPRYRDYYRRLQSFREEHNLSFRIELLTPEELRVRTWQPGAHGMTREQEIPLLSDRIATLLANRPVVEERVRERIERLISLTTPTSLADLDAAFHGAIQAGGLSRHLDDAVAAGRLQAPDRDRINAVLPPSSPGATSAESGTATGDSPEGTDRDLRDASVYQVRTPSLYRSLDGLLHEAMTGKDPGIEGIVTLARARRLAARDITDVRSRGRAAASGTNVHASGRDGHDVAPTERVTALPAGRSAPTGPSDRPAGSWVPVRPRPESAGTMVGALRVSADEVRIATDRALHVYRNTEDDDLAGALATEWQLSRDATQRLLTDTSAFLAPFFRGVSAGTIGTNGPRAVAQLVTAAAFRRNQLPDTTGLKDKHPATEQRELPESERGDADARLAEALSAALLGWRDHENTRPLEDLGLDHRHFDRDALRDQGKPGLRGGMPGPSPRLVTQIPLTRFYDSSVRALLAYGSFREDPREEKSVKAQHTMQNVLQLLRRMRTTHSVNAMHRLWEIPAPNRPALRAAVLRAQVDGMLPSNSDVMVDIMHTTGLGPALGSQHNPLRNITAGQPTPRATLVKAVVQQIVERMHRALDHGDAKEFLKQLRPLDRHFDDLRLIEFVWTQTYGTRMPAAAVNAFPDHAGQIRYWSGETNSINPDSPWSHPYSGEVINHVYPEEANALLDQLRNTTVHYPPLGDIQALSWYPDDGSALRVHAWANELKRRGYAPLKIFAYGGETGISVARMQNSFDNSRHGHFPAPPPPIGRGGSSEMSPVEWRYHAAIAMTVMHESHLKQWVLDPSLSGGTTMSVREWAHAMQLDSRYDLHALTLPELHRLLIRQYHDHPDSWHRTSALQPASPMRRKDVMDSTLMLMPKHAMIAITEIHAILPPTPDQSYPISLEQANQIAANNYSVLSNQSIVGERRHAARKMIRQIDELNAASWNIILEIIDTTRPEALWGIVEEHPRLELALLDTFDADSLEIIYARIRAAAPSHIIQDVEFPYWSSQTFGTSEEA
ncbi:protein-glutamine glutaminase family protein [Streptomyces sp900105755]|uniref:protein-glutamine glutaminase family protein n=1 Tax=Streptomyces sp. 900105755 TaxID=3154389 RepID=UPI003323FF82